MFLRAEKVCKGEHWCQNESGGKIFESKRGFTLENFCHKDKPTINGNKMQGCPLYPTKPENIPAQVYSIIRITEELRRKEKRGHLPPLEELSPYENIGLDVVDDIISEIESERISQADPKSKTPTQNSPIGKLGQDG